MKRILFALTIFTLIFSGLFLQPVFVSAAEPQGWQESLSCQFLGATNFMHLPISQGAENLYHALYSVPAQADSKHIVNYNPTYGEVRMLWSYDPNRYADDVPEWLALCRSLLSFNTGDLDSDDEIVDGRIKLKFSQVLKNIAIEGGYALSFFPYTGDAEYPFGIADWGKLDFDRDPNGHQLTEAVTWATIKGAYDAGQYVTFELTKAGIDYINRSGNTKMWLRFSFDGAGLDGLPGVSNYHVQYQFYKTGSAVKPLFELEYLPGIVTREWDCETNAAVGGSGNSITGVSWLTPRCAFDDEKVGFRIEGAAGTNFTAQLVGSSDVLEEISDSIRVNNYFYWCPELGGYTGKFRCHVGAKNSTWGWSEQFSMAGTQRTFAMNLENEQASWLADVDDYQVHQADTVMVWYWLSSMEIAEIADVSLTIRQGGAQANDIYSSSFSSLVSDYMECIENDNYFLIASRYILASFGTVADDLDGLILDFDNPLVDLAKGYYYARVLKTGSGILIPVSAYWYVEDCDLTACPPSCDLAIYLVTGQYAIDQVMPVIIHNDASLNFYNRFRDARLSVVGSAAEPVVGVITSGAYSIDIIRPQGAQMLLLEISTTLDDYVHHSFLPLPAESGLPGGIPEWPSGIPNLPAIWAWFTSLFGSSWGHYLLLLLLMAIIALIFYRKHRTVAIILCLVVIAFGIVIGWIDVWLVVLLSIGGGLIIWKFVVGQRGAG